jgi:hypothetical protein
MSEIELWEAFLVSVQHWEVQHGASYRPGRTESICQAPKQASKSFLRKSRDPRRGRIDSPISSAMKTVGPMVATRWAFVDGAGGRVSEHREGTIPEEAELMQFLAEIVKLTDLQLIDGHITLGTFPGEDTTEIVMNSSIGKSLKFSQGMF